LTIGPESRTVPASPARARLAWLTHASTMRTLLVCRAVHRA